MDVLGVLFNEDDNPRGQGRGLFVSGSNLEEAAEAEARKKQVNADKLPFPRQELGILHIMQARPPTAGHRGLCVCVCARARGSARVRLRLNASSRGRRRRTTLSGSSYRRRGGMPTAHRSGRLASGRSRARTTRR